MDFTNTSNVNNSNSNSYGNSNGSNSSNSYGVNFQLPQIDLSSISSVFNPRNFNIASNLEELMSFATKSNNKSFNGCDSCGLKFNLLKRKVWHKLSLFIIFLTITHFSHYRLCLI